MIKEKKKNTKFNIKKTKLQILIECIRTIFCAFLCGTVITIGLVMHARNEIIKNPFLDPHEQSRLEKKIALEIISESDLLKDLTTKNYKYCMRVGEIYEIAGEYANSQKAYESAIKKTKPNNFTPYQKLIFVLVAQENFDEVDLLLDSIKDRTDKGLIKFKTRSYLTIGDKYYSMGKFLSAAKAYERARFYYNKFSKKDSEIEKSIMNRILNSYIKVADVMVKNGLNSDAVRYLKKAENYDNENFMIKYKLAIVYSDLDPELSVSYFDSLLKEIPQEIDYDIYNLALMKSANIVDLDGRTTQAKYYRYKIHSNDLYIKRKVIYKNDLEITINSFSRKKVLFSYPLKVTYGFLNTSNYDIKALTGDFILCQNDKPIETITKSVATNDTPLLISAEEPNLINIEFKKKIFTKKELDTYTIKIYLYKDKKFKTLVCENIIPKSSF